jgi:hypothetical protein
MYEICMSRFSGGETVSNWNPIDLGGVHAYPLARRSSKVRFDDFGKPWSPRGEFNLWLRFLPNILAAKDFRNASARIVRAVRGNRMVLLAMGAHVIKVGLNPLVIDLMEKGIIRGLAMNGAGMIHDTEIAMAGQTSEDVAAQLGEGRFGMAEEPAIFLNEAIRAAAKSDTGLGAAVGARLSNGRFPYGRCSLLGRAFELGVPVTVHVAIGTDTIHFHPSADGASVGKATHMDFRLFASLVSQLEGGVFINLGSAVIMPEVFLKALSLVRNLGHDVKKFTTLNMDFIRHYRPMTNVVHRPTLEGGEGYSITGHHEIMFPLLAAAVVEGLADND